MSAKKEKILKNIEKGIKEFDLMQSGKLTTPDFNTVLEDLKTERENRGGAGRGQGRKPAGYTTRIWVTPEEKAMILATRTKVTESKV